MATLPRRAISLILLGLLAGSEAALAFKPSALQRLLADGLCSGCDLRGAPLAQTLLDGADLRGADLRRANLRHARLDGANLHGARLEGADLRGARLRGANLLRVDLYEVRLAGADLREANLGHLEIDTALEFIDLVGVQLEGARFANGRRCGGFPARGGWGCRAVLEAEP